MQQVLVDDGSDGGVTVEQRAQRIVADTEHFGIRQRPDARGSGLLVDEGVLAEAIAATEFVQPHRRDPRFRLWQKGFRAPFEHDVQVVQLVAFLKDDAAGGDRPGFAAVEQRLAQRLGKAIEDLVAVELDLGHRVGLQ